MKNWKRTICLAAALGLAAPFGLNGADKEEKKEGEADKAEENVVPPGEKMEAVMKGYEEGNREYFEKLRKAKTAEERVGLMRPDAGEAALEVVELVKAAPDDPVAREAIFWVARTAMREEAVMAEVFAVLENHFLDAEGVERVCLMMPYLTHPMRDPFLNRMRKKSGHEPARGAAIFALGQIRNRAGKPGEAEKLFEEVVKNYADVEIPGRTLGDLAEGELFAMRNLKVGKEAPEIEGEKADGKPFKLSDYRGKVVVLDFFGDW